MKQLNRTIEPITIETTTIDNPIVKKITLENGTNIRIVNGGSQEILKLDFIFDAGTYYQDSPVIASMCSAMLNEGSKKYTAREIAEIFDFHGAYMNTSITNHKGIISLICLSKDLDKLLDIIEDVIKNSIFPENEFNTIKTNRKKGFLLELEKTSSLARKHFLRNMMGENHSYSNIVEEKDFEKLKREDLVRFYKTQYSPKNCNIMICGKIEDNHIEAIKNRFSDHFGENNKKTLNHYDIKSNSKKEHFIKKEKAAQSSIRIGCLSINKKHKDWTGLEITNTILGGYFGSRLMSNIREDKGYTYGISSAVASLPDTGYFAIATDVGNDVRDLTINEIYKEIDILHKELVGEDELNLVKNYMTGELLRALDGPFSISEMVNLNLLFDIEDDHYQRKLDTIRNITAKEIQQLAIKYIKKEELFEIIVGA